MHIRHASNEDVSAIWPIFKQIVEQGTTYGFDPKPTYEYFKQVWFNAPEHCFVCEEQGQIVATYYLKTNQAGPGSHVCNCGYMVDDKHRGKGIATAMCIDSQNRALQLNYKAMQFNYVASTNRGAIKLWQTLGFDIVGTLPNAFNHPQQGYVDAFVMYKCLV